MKRDVTFSRVHFLFSFSLALCGAAQFRTVLKLLLNPNINSNPRLVNLYSFPTYYLSVLIIFILNFFFVAPSTKKKLEEHNPWPEEEASMFSKLFLLWCTKFMWRAYKSPLSEGNLWNLHKEMRTAQIQRRFQSKWNLALNRVKPQRLKYRFIKVRQGKQFHEDDSEVEEIVRNIDERSYLLGNDGRAPPIEKEASIVRPLIEVFWFKILVGFICGTASSLLLVIAPLILKLILGFVANESEFSWHGYWYVFLLLAAAALRVIIYVHHAYLLVRCDLGMRTALMSAIYEKALKISSSVRKDFTYGEIVNLMAVDVQRFYFLLFYICTVWTATLEISLSIYFLWNILGGSCALAGTAFLIFSMVLSGAIISKIRALEMEQMKCKDKRIKCTNEILSGIRVVKLYACEPSFEKRVNEIRKIEIGVLRRIAYLQALSTFLWIFTPFMISFIMFGLYVFLNEKHVLDVQVVFVSLALLKVLQADMRAIPDSLTPIVRAHVSIKRINKFLNTEELDLNAVSHEKCSVPVMIENGTFSWESSEGPAILRDINLKVRKGTLVAVVGPVGSGKSSLLSAILGEMYKQSGFVNTVDRLAYVAQESWIQNASLENNITFGETRRKAFYSTVLEACALVPDLEILPAGDQTEIGEKGINLSGGQKQRVNLARSVFAEADTYLLDDPLSAVDAHVGKHIFEQVIGPNGLLEKKTRIFATHNISYLSQVDHIIVLKNGMISEAGTYKKLLKKGGEFANLLSTYSENNDECSQTENHTKAEVKSSDENGEKERLLNRRQKSPQSENCKEKTKIAAGYRLTENEETQTGNIKWNVITYYFSAMGTLYLIAIVLSNLLWQAFSIASDYWLSAWTSPENSNSMIQQYINLGVYALFGLGQAVCVIAQTFTLCFGMLKAAKYLHNSLLSSVLHWPINTFDKIPTGRIINRFGSDVDVLDNTLPKDGLELLACAGIILSTIFVISLNTPLFIVVLLPVGVICFFFQRIYTASSKQFRRMESVTKSNIYSHFGDTILGAQSIRAYNLRTKFIEALENKIDYYLKFSHPLLATLCAFMLPLGILCSSLLFTTSLFAIIYRNSIGIALIGLSITYALSMTKYAQLVLKICAETETNIIAIERIKEYTEIEQEAPWICPTVDNAVSNNWPQKGAIIFKNLRFRYRKDLELVLKDLSFKINSGEKVGVVGRTGAGKSSLILSLFRIIESAGGSIFIDDIDISKVGLHTLRSRLTVIPQDPVLFLGTLRLNLDPEEKYSDERIWEALELVSFKKYVSTLQGGLLHQMEEGGSNFSVGQRQLICLARALLRRTRILILDEATAAVDFETDNLIQTTIRTEFNERTVITIAHRLNTVIDYDRRAKVKLLNERGQTLPAFAAR